MLELAFELNVLHHSVNFWPISIFGLFLKCTNLNAILGVILKYETKLKVLWGAQDWYSDNFWLQLDDSHFFVFFGGPS